MGKMTRSLNKNTTLLFFSGDNPVPYVRNVSECIRRILAPLKIRTCFRPLTTLKRMLVHPKDKIPEDMKRGVVYQIQCGTCKKTYIGQTGRTLKHRVKEHRRALISHNANFSAVAEHAMRDNHDITWDEASVIDGNDKWIQRCHLEGWYIRLMKSAMNRDEGFLPSDYDYLIRMVRNRQSSSNSHEH